MSVAVVIVTYRSGKWIKTCLDSVITQGMVSSIWVVDNASDDDTVAIVRDNYPDVHVIANDDNKGFAAANNQALSVIEEKFILLLNPDAFLEACAVKYMVQGFEGNHVGIVAPRIIRDEMIEESICGRPSAWASCLFMFTGMRNFKMGGFSGKPISGYPWDDGVKGEHVRGSCLMVAKGAVEDAGLLDEVFFLYFEETEWCLRLRNHGWAIKLVPNAIAHHAGRASVKTESALPSLEFIRGAIIFWQIYYSRWIAFILRMVLFSMAAAKFLVLRVLCRGQAKQGWLKDVMKLALNPFKLPIIYPKATRPAQWDKNAN